MYSVYCETCSETAEAEAYAAANEIFMEHFEASHDVELVNDRYAAD